jgi:hypothetical protein
LPTLRNYRSKRSSSFDTTGCNDDYRNIQPGQAINVFDCKAPGVIRHIWMTFWNHEIAWPRRVVLKAFWDGESHPSIECPIGDFFGIGFGILKNFTSAALQMSPENGQSLNCWFPMPFESAKIEVHNEGASACNIYYYFDYEEWEDFHDLPKTRFHCSWNRVARTPGWQTQRYTQHNTRDLLCARPNLTGQDNYNILDAKGSGVYVGCNLSIDVFEPQPNDWFGEGDDMIFIDGEAWPPSLHGTGTEDYFCSAFSPKQEFCAPYHGITVYSGTEDWPWSGKNCMYRHHILDPIRFRESIRVSIEHGSSNDLSNDYSSAAYWYQSEPHDPFPNLLPCLERMPR